MRRIFLIAAFSLFPLLGTASAANEPPPGDGSGGHECEREKEPVTS